MAKTLTAAGIRTLRATDRRQEIRDGASVGLYLVVQPSGHKSFALRFRRPDGKPAKLVLGPFDPSAEGEDDPVIGQPLTLAAARRLASDLGRERARGRDIVADRKAAKARKLIQYRERAANSFGQAVMDFIELHAKAKTRRWQVGARLLGVRPDGSLIRDGLADRWADRPVADISGHDVYALTEECRHRGVPGWGVRKDDPSESRARALFSTLSTMYTWLARHRRVEQNPCASVHRPDPAAARDRVLTDGEIVRFWQAASAEEHVGPVLKLLLMTGSRLSEVAGMRRSELSSDGLTWTLPGGRTKNGKPHVVPLAPQARELIQSVPNLGTDLVFTTTNGRVAVSGWSKVKRRLDAGMAGVPPWRLHDLRRSAATHMAEIGIAPHIVEAALNHISGAKAGVAGTYNRALYAAEKKSALERWAAHVEALVAGRSATVVPMRRQP